MSISRGTVLEAYEQLAAEGWLLGRQGSGTVVAAAGVAGQPAADAEAEAEAVSEPLIHDLRPGRPDPTSFPRAAWLRALRRALSSASASVLAPGDPRGDPRLREELAEYLSRARGLRVSPQLIVVTSGFTQSLSLISRMLAARGGELVAVEDPCMAHHRAVISSAGLRLEPLAVEADGARIDGLLQSRHPPAAVVLTPNRQFPLGMPLAPNKRVRLLDWARSTGSIVVEDDYDAEFRYDGQPVGALQGLEPRAVIYAGTASKTLAPGLRLGWMVLPPGLLEPMVEQKRLADWQTGVLDQLALAELIGSGHYDRHIRRMRLRYRRRRDRLVGSLGGIFSAGSIAGSVAGLHVIVRLPSAGAERHLLDAARRGGVELEGLVADRYTHRSSGQSPAGLIIGYGAPPEHAYGAAVSALTTALGEAGRRTRRSSASPSRVGQSSRP